MKKSLLKLLSFTVLLSLSHAGAPRNLRIQPALLRKVGFPSTEELPQIMENYQLSDENEVTLFYIYSRYKDVDFDPSARKIFAEELRKFKTELENLGIQETEDEALSYGQSSELGYDFGSLLARYRRGTMSKVTHEAVSKLFDQLLETLNKKLDQVASGEDSPKESK